VPLPETISAKYTEETVGHMSVRPVTPQTFRAAELVDMVVQVTGKDAHRVAQILRAGSITFHSYRYWWDGFSPEAEPLREILDTYPDADPSRPFAAEKCTAVILESSGSPPRHSLRITREEASKKRGLFGIFSSGDFWEALMKFGADSGPRNRLHYREYSYALRADLYARALSAEEVVRLAGDANRYAARELRAELIGVPSVSQIVLVCAR
jgi:hypothetical protein